MAYPADDPRPAGLTFIEVDESDASLVGQTYALLQEALGAENVEDSASFRRTVSPLTDDAVVPRLVCAVHERRVLGAVVGTYLKNLNIGMVLYAAVSRPLRGRGIYSILRGQLTALLNGLASERYAGSRRSLDRHAGIEYLVSEQEEGSALLRRYVNEWGAFVARCRYEQPATQGLVAKELKLVMQPMANRTRPTRDDTIAIVREIYAHIYGLSNGALSARLRPVVESLEAPPGGMPAYAGSSTREAA